MNEMIIKEMSKDLNISEKQVQTVLTLLSEGNTIPFIERYRKEATGAVGEEDRRSICLSRENNKEKRRCY